MLANLVKLSLVALALPITALAGSHGNLLNRHHDLAKRQPGTVETFNRRTDNARMSFYNVETGNAGSCGKVHVNSDFTVAMNQGQMNSGMCFKTISISYGGKTTIATVSDTCPGCPYGGLDLTEGLFSFFAPHSVGIIYGEWHFTDGNDDAPKPVAPPPPPPPPKTTKKPTSTWTPPSTIWTPPPPTTTWKPPVSIWTPPTTSKTPKKTSTTWTSTTPTTTKTSTSTTSTSKSSTKSETPTSTTSSQSSTIDYNTGAAAGLAVPTGTINTPAGSTENIANMYQAFVQVGGLIAGAAAN